MTALSFTGVAHTGSLQPLRDLMTACEGLDNRQQLLHVLGGAEDAALLHLASDPPLVKLLLHWLMVS